MILDLSDDNGPVDYKTLGAAKNADGTWLVEAVIAQATEGLTVTNTSFRTHHNGCKTARPDGSPLPFGAYHFFYDQDDGAAQAAFFLRFIDGYQGQALPMLDFERAGFRSGNPQQFIANAVKLRERVRASLPVGKFPLHYFELDFWIDTLHGYDGFAGGPAWPAAYNDDADLSMAGTGWERYTLWQYTDAMRVPGIGGNVDASRLHPTLTLAAILR